MVSSQRALVFSSVAAAIVCAGTLKLPAPETTGVVTVEQALLHRRSVRNFSQIGVELAAVSQLLWAGQGRTTGWGGRPAPSAGATYPVELYLVAGLVNGLQAGVYRYLPEVHSVEVVRLGDVREELVGVSLRQVAIRKAPATLVLTCDYRRTTGKYGERGVRYVHMEAGHVGQNVHLQCEALGLGTVMIGAFVDEGVKRVLRIAHEPLYIMPVGYPEGE